MTDVLLMLKRKRSMILAEVYAIKSGSGSISISSFGGIRHVRICSTLKKLEKELEEIEKLIAYHEEKSSA